MVRLNAHSGVNYGATSSLPPPYSGAPPPNSGPPVASSWSSFEPPRAPNWLAWMNTRSSIAFLTFLATMGVCMLTMPLTYCNDPADPQVRIRVREQWSMELLEHEKQVAEHEIVKAQWAWEDERHAMILREWEQERVQHEWELKERAQREEEERQELNLFWGRVEAHTCTTYGTREYTAQLMNLPAAWEHRVGACEATPLEVHGVSYLPKSCEDKGPGVVIGRWTVNQHEPDCAPFWSWYKDKGCTSPGSGKRRIEHYLDYLPYGGDWREFCATTPARFHGMEFAGAQECFQYNFGTYGHWEIDAADCQ